MIRSGKKPPLPSRGLRGGESPGAAEWGVRPALLPFPDLVRVNLERRRQLRQRPVALQRLRGHLALELRLNTSTGTDYDDFAKSGQVLTERYNIIGNNEGSGFGSGLPNANGSHVGSPALRLVPRGESPYYNGSPAEDQRGYFISSPVGHDDYNNRTAGACWDGATATPARGFRGQIR